MTDKDHATAAAPMEGGGGYNLNSRVQAAGLLPAVSLLEQAARTVTFTLPPEPIVIADYGSSQRHNSLLPISAMIASLRTRVGSEWTISVVHTDLQGNDFAALFRTLADDPDSYLRGNPAVFASAVGRSFYGQILPPKSVTLGWSSWAVQWLSRTPAEIPDHVPIAYSQRHDVRTAFVKLAAEDWRAFLEARGRELRPGGRLVVLTMASDVDGAFGYQPLLDDLYDSLRGMVSDRSLVHAEQILRPARSAGREVRDAAPSAGRSMAGRASRPRSRVVPVVLVCGVAPLGTGGIVGVGARHAGSATGWRTVGFSGREGRSGPYVPTAIAWDVRYESLREEWLLGRVTAGVGLVVQQGLLSWVRADLTDAGIAGGGVNVVRRTDIVESGLVAAFVELIRNRHPEGPP